tara:strand:- start:6667 stop:6990 length:324 start_codon:yes stop_codon:yes gene_type:complete
MPEFDEQALLNLPLEELKDFVVKHLEAIGSAPPQTETSPPSPASLPEQTAAPAPPTAEVVAPAGMGAERQESGMAEDPFSPESRLSAARAAISRQQRIRENPPKDIY